MAGVGDRIWLGRTWKAWKGPVEPLGSLCSHLDYMVMVGDINVKRPSTTAVKVRVQDIVIHKDYNPFGTIENDIALALLELPVKYSSHIQPVCFPEKAFQVRAGTECWVTGWGKLHEKGEAVTQDCEKLGSGERLPAALGLACKPKRATGRQFSSKRVREKGVMDGDEIPISMSGPRGMGDKQGGFFLGWILALGEWGVALSANLSYLKVEVLALVDRAFSVSE